MRVLMLGCRGSIHAIRPLQFLLDANWDVVYVDNTNPYPHGRMNFTFIYYPLIGRCISRRVGKQIGSWVADLYFIPFFKQVREKYHPDITHVHWVDCHAYYCVRAGLKPLVLSVWGSDINNCFRQDINQDVRKLIGEALSSADRVIIDSREMAEKCNRLANKNLPTELIHLGVNLSLFKPGYQNEAVEWRKKLNISSDGIVFLSNRGFSKPYQHEQIIEAFALALPHLKKPTWLIFKKFNQLENSYMSHMRQRIQDLGLSEKIRWLEVLPFERLPEIYAMADVIVNNPVQDTFPISFIEAAACQRPVISCRLPSYASTFAERYFSFFEPGQIEQLAETMINYVNDPPQSPVQNAALRKEIEAKFNESIYKQRLSELYLTTISGKRTNTE